MLDVTPPEARPEYALAAIPIVETGADFALATLDAHPDKVTALLDAATARAPGFALQLLDRISRRWLERWQNPFLPEIEAVATRLARPGVYFFSVNYEWGCTCRVAPAPDHASARLIRVLDWRTPGLGRNLLAARIRAPAGPFIALTWPGYTGVLSAMAPGRFSAALNQAPMRMPFGLLPLDWAANRHRVWTMPHQMPAHLLRRVFEQATCFAEARERLAREPVSTPAIFTLAGTKAHELAVIERTETEARVHEGANVAANNWQAAGWRGRPRGRDSAERAHRMHTIAPTLDPAFPWLATPILNPMTRLVMVADAGQGALVARGYEAMEPATAPLVLSSL